MLENALFIHNEKLPIVKVRCNEMRTYVNSQNSKCNTNKYRQQRARTKIKKGGKQGMKINSEFTWITLWYDAQHPANSPHIFPVQVRDEWERELRIQWERKKYGINYLIDQSWVESEEKKSKISNSKNGIILFSKRIQSENFSVILYALIYLNCQFPISGKMIKIQWSLVSSIIVLTEWINQSQNYFKEFVYESHKFRVVDLIVN